MTNNSTAVSNVIPFSFEAKQVRTILINDQPWFVAADVCASLALSNVSLAVNGRADRTNDGLDEDEKGIATVNTPSGAQEMLVVNESGLYSLTFKSRKAEAKRFKRWVTSEVLPAIRKHGKYVDQTGRMSTLIGQTIGTDGFHMLGAVVKGKVAGLPQMAQRRATAKIWSQTHAAFGVRSAADIPADQLDSARNFIAAYAVIEGEYIPRHSGAIPDNLRPDQRFMISTDAAGRKKTEAIPADAYVLTFDEFIRSMLGDGDMLVSTAEMFRFVALATENLRIRSLSQARRSAA